MRQVIFAAQALEYRIRKEEMQDPQFGARAMRISSEAAAAGTSQIVPLPGRTR